MKKETLDGKIRDLVQIDTVAGFPVYSESAAVAAAGEDTEDVQTEDVKISDEKTFFDLDASISQLLNLQEESEEREIKEGKEQTVKGKLESLNYF